MKCFKSKINFKYTTILQEKKAKYLFNTIYPKYAIRIFHRPHLGANCALPIRRFITSGRLFLQVFTG